ncbi:HPr family phosphocarrier protein [Paracoccus aerodenitrificans]|uniref:HPr family phosphocarrier protein n=1 Tax=Paracoccus aerodenitrificans TaxID=3017781 RepID=UPI0022F066E6|nr:HPr family phosphocarrier protein [Paracoccus aerodenitrificans]WBU63400.1 HPr family phosphocarrier protein [Paracoccus aerodenitrificans]
MSSDAGRVLPIVNEKGLHARASAKFVELVERFDAEAQVSRDGMTVSGDSIMGLLMLAASRGSQITLKTTGPQAEELAAELEALVARRFDEDR